MLVLVLCVSSEGTSPAGKHRSLSAITASSWMVFLGLIVFFSAVSFGSVYSTKLQSRYLNSYQVNQLIAIAA